MKEKKKQKKKKEEEKVDLDKLFPKLKPFKLPPRVQVSKEEFLLRLRNISEWRKRHLAEIRSQNPR